MVPHTRTTRKRVIKSHARRTELEPPTWVGGWYPPPNHPPTHPPTHAFSFENAPFLQIKYKNLLLLLWRNTIVGNCSEIRDFGKVDSGHWVNIKMDFLSRFFKTARYLKKISAIFSGGAACGGPPGNGGHSIREARPPLGGQNPGVIPGEKQGRGGHTLYTI